jgi:hypothetical protein
LSKREYQIAKLLKIMKEEELKNKSLKYHFYKEIGFIQETDKNILNDKTHKQLVEEEVTNMKNFSKRIYQNIGKSGNYEKVKKEKIIEEDKRNNTTRNILFSISFLYLISFFYLTQQKNNKKQNLEKQKKQKNLENNFIYFKNRS